MENKKLYLAYVKPYADNPNNTFDYVLFFTDTPDIVWGLDWECQNPAICEDLTPDYSGIQKMKIITSRYKLKTIQETSCYSMEYAIEGIIALSWVDLDILDEYPEDRCVLHFRDSEEYVTELIKTIEVKHPEI